MSRCYSLTIYDYDVGGTIHEQRYDIFSQLVNDVYDMLFECSDDGIDEEIAEKDRKNWSVEEICSTLAKFNFMNGMMDWNCYFPGKRRQIIVKMNSY